MRTANILLYELKRECKNPIWYLLFGIYILFLSLAMGSSIQMNMSSLEYVLYSLCDHYFLIYGWFLSYLFWISRNHKNVSTLSYIRMGSRKEYENIRLYSTMLISGLVIGCLILLALLYSLPFLELQNTFKLHSQDPYYHIFEAWNRPLAALLSVGLYLWLGSIFFYQLLTWIHAHFSRIWYLVSYFLILASVLLGFIGNWDEGVLGIFFFNNYFIFHHSYLVSARYNFYIICILLLLSFLPRLCYKRRKSKGKQYLRAMLGKSHFLALLMLFLMMLFTFFHSLLKGDSVVEYLFVLLKGYSSNNFHLLEFMQHLFWMLLPLFVLGIFWEREEQLFHKLGRIRCVSMKHWNRLMTYSNFYFLVSYTTAYLGLILGSTWAYAKFTQTSSASFLEDLMQQYSTMAVSFENYVTITLLLRAAELFVLSSICLLLYKFCHNTVISYLFMVLAYGLSLLPIKLLPIPFGISSMYRLLEEGTAFLAGDILALLLWLAVTQLILYFRRNYYEPYH